MRKSNIGIDLDGVVCDLYKHTAKALKELHDINAKPFEEQDSYSYENMYGLSTKQVTELFAKVGEAGGYRDSEVFPFARKSLVRLSRLYNIYYVTVRDFYPAIKKDTFYWLDKNKLPYFRVVFTRSKYKVAQKERFQFFLDDNPDQCNRMAKTMVPTYMMKQPWNDRSKADSLVKIVTDWREVEKILSLV